MGTRKSQSEINSDLLSQILFDVALLSGTPLRRVLADAKTLAKRTRCEGFTFLTVTLLTLGKAIDRSFETGALEVPAGFRTCRNSKIPVLFQEFFRLVYNEDGTLRSDYSNHSVVVAGLRQICYFFYKVEVDFPPSFIDKVISDFIERDEELKPVEPDEVLLLASDLLQELFEDFEPDDITPGHGPGVVATGEKFEEKWTLNRVYSSIEPLYPHSEYFSVLNESVEQPESYQSRLKHHTHGVSKLILVPKDSRGPRLICAEPLEFQYVQQGLWKKLLHHVEHHPMTRHSVFFTDASIHRNRAIVGSLIGELSTVDLKDASDRVSLSLVQTIFPDDLLEYLEATRSSHVRTPKGEEYAFKKFAPMGSALCFPIEALTFWSIALATVLLETPGDHHWFPFRSKVVVYGDDLIVPTEHLQAIMRNLEAYSLKINREKTFSKGPFRESCGKDAYYGYDVTPVKLRKDPRKILSDFPSCFPHLVEATNLLFEKGFWRGAECLLNYIEQHSPVPYGTVDSGYPCLMLRNPYMVDYLNHLKGFTRRWNRALQRYEYYFLVIKTKEYRARGFEGWGRELKGLISPGADDPEVFDVRRKTYVRHSWV